MTINESIWRKIIMQRKYTYQVNPEIIKIIDHHLEFIKKVILNEFPDVVSILLVGAFGRNEGSVMIKEKKIIPLNDYDFILFFRKRISRYKRKKIKEISKRLASKIQIDFIDLISYTLKDLKNTNFIYSQFYVESYYGHYIVFDTVNIQNLLPKIEYKSISKESLKLILLNRLTCLLESTDKLNQDNGIDYFYRQTSKAIIACIDVILLSSGIFHHLYEIKGQLFQNLEYPEEVKHLVKKAIEIKLNIIEKSEKEKILEFWDSAIILYANTCQKFFKDFLHLNDLLSFKEFYDKYSKKYMNISTRIIRYICKKFNLPYFKIISYHFLDQYRYDDISLIQLFLIYIKSGIKIKDILVFLHFSKLLGYAENYYDYEKLRIKTLDLWYKYKH